ncbi:hypothetical protein ACFGVS_11450 [Mucilaginibacter sp. AW1-7]|uniref:hypothetical protein n=1 Tax=unclassified Mucilaginibacter TaxID=2617802 RepID=UPI0008C88A10|nr:MULTISPECIES: hypothetical protein [unclassified Mucilaginibacter]WDF79787.1 hypothetical protein PQ469_07170 [Mucilaginibacter sp. KACC 22773]SEO64174.1 hypothetical protein SAMN05428947_103236 [Mucilaginibacter sp. OK283]
MDFVITFGAILLSLCLLLMIGVLFAGVLKYIKKQYHPNPKFSDYVNVDSAEYAYKRIEKRTVR